MPLISVVIPTRNRNQYLLDSIQIAIEKIKDVEIIVCDNSDDDSIRSMLASALTDPLVKYSYSAEKLTVVENFERALKATTGDYVIFIGDDDAIGPGIEEIAQWAKENKIDAVVSYRHSFLAAYYWPGVKSKYFGDSYAAQLFVSEFSGKVTELDPVKALKEVAQQPGGGLGELPRAYHGLISRGLIEKIINRHGHLFGGVSPDIYSAALIASSCERAVVVDYPFVIPGASPVSTAGQGAERSDRGNLKTTEHTARFGDTLVWDQRIPAFYSPHTVWAYSLCKALEHVPSATVTPSFGRLYACCFLYYRKNYRELRIAMKVQEKNQGYWRFTIDFFINVVKEVSGLLWRMTARVASPRAGGRAQRFGRHDTVSSAYRALEKYIATSGVKLELPSNIKMTLK